MLSIQGVILKIDAYRSFWHALYYFLSAKNTLYGSEKNFLNSFLCLLLLIFYLLYDVIGKYIFNRTKIEQISKWHCRLKAGTCSFYQQFYPLFSIQYLSRFLALIHIIHRFINILCLFPLWIILFT